MDSWFLSLVIINKCIHVPAISTTSSRFLIMRWKIYTGFVMPMSYMPFGLSEPRRVPMPPARSTAPALPARIVSSPVLVNSSLFAFISSRVIAFIGVITPRGFSFIPLVTLAVTEKSVPSICERSPFWLSVLNLL